jgi:hypothetical protein
VRQLVQHAHTVVLVRLQCSVCDWTTPGARRSDAERAAFICRWSRLRLAIDAVVIALMIGEQCVEGVRRIATPSAATLLRSNAALSPEWVRTVIGRFAHYRGQLLHLTTTFALVAAAQRAEAERAVFYVDNHLRPYTGKHTIRKGWRMQDKRVRPGMTDFYVHDEDGRPLSALLILRTNHFAAPASVAAVLRAALDRAGANNTRSCWSSIAPERSRPGDGGAARCRSGVRHVRARATSYCRKTTSITLARAARRDDPIHRGTAKESAWRPRPYGASLFSCPTASWSTS